MSLGKKILVVFLIVILGISAFIGYTYLTIIKPVMGLEIYPEGIEPITLSPLVLNVLISVYNPGEATTLPSADINIYLNGEYIGSGIMKEISIAKGEEKTIEARISITKTLSELLQMTTTGNKIEIDGKLHTPLVSIPIPKIPIPTTKDFSGILTAEIGPNMPNIPLLIASIEENPEMTLQEAIKNEKVISRVKEEFGKNITEEELAQLEESLPPELKNITIDDLLKNPELLQEYTSYLEPETQ
jgi:hypothetical protein